MDKIIPEVGTVPTFLLKLVNLLKDEENHKYIMWNDTGTSFIVKDQVGFARNVLPKYFKHNKFASFVRQLNMYGFRKITSLIQSGLKVEKEEVEFYHYLFIRDQEYLLEQIKRKVPKPDDTSRQSEEIAKVLSDVTHLKTQQEDINIKLSDLKQENEILWKEVVNLRQKHSHQQTVVNKLIQFLVNLVQQHGMGVKRKLPLMIESGTSDVNYHPKSKYLKEVFSGEERSANQSSITPVGFPTIIDPHSATDNSQPSVTLCDNPTDNSQSSMGPYITEIGSPDSEKNHGSTFHKMPVNTDLINPLNFAFDMSEYVNPEIRNNIVEDVFTPVSLPDMSSEDSSNQAATSSIALQSTDSNNELTHYVPLKRSLSNHVDLVQNNLNDIQQRLTNKDEIQLDYSLIQELFGSSPDLMPTLTRNIDESPITGNELVLHSNKDEDGFQFEDELSKLTKDL